MWLNITNSNLQDIFNTTLIVRLISVPITKLQRAVYIKEMAPTKIIWRCTLLDIFRILLYHHAAHITSQTTPDKSNICTLKYIFVFQILPAIVELQKVTSFKLFFFITINISQNCQVLTAVKIKLAIYLIFVLSG